MWQHTAVHIWPLKNSFLELNTLVQVPGQRHSGKSPVWRQKLRETKRWVLGGSESVVLTGVTSPIWVKKSMEKWSFLSYFYFVFVKISFGKIKHLDLFMEIAVMVTGKKLYIFFHRVWIDLVREGLGCRKSQRRVVASPAFKPFQNKPTAEYNLGHWTNKAFVPQSWEAAFNSGL